MDLEETCAHGSALVLALLGERSEVVTRDASSHVLGGLGVTQQREPGEIEVVDGFALGGEEARRGLELDRQSALGAAERC
ncbi:MAG: hypothetical protein R3F65_31975 [bacterium]